MALDKITYVDGVTVITAKNLNDIQDAVISNEGSISDKADKSDTYTKAEVDSALSGKADASDTYTKAEVDSALADKADESELGDYASLDVVEDVTMIQNNASGSIASFADGADYPVKELIADINATQSGSGDPSPSNVRPISGWSAVNVNVRGGNLWDEETLLGYYSGTGVYTSANNQLCTKNKIHVLPNTTYFIKVPVSQLAVYVCEYDSNNSFIARTSFSTGSTEPYGNTYTTSSNCAYITINFMTGYGTTYKNDISVNYPSTDHDYHPHNSNGTTHNIPLGQTVYGGKLNVTTGELVITHGIVDLGTMTWSSRTINGVSRICSNAIENILTPASDYYPPMAICDVYKMVTVAQVGSADGSASIGPHQYGYGDRIIINDSRITDPSQASTVLNGNKICITLATPQTVTLTPTEVHSLLGQNNIFADSGDVYVTYIANTKKYIDGTIVEVPLAMIAPIETGTTASKAYAVGDYFILNGNQFCKARTSIASGATFTLNTNYTVTTIGAELKALQ